MRVRIVTLVLCLLAPSPLVQASQLIDRGRGKKAFYLRDYLERYYSLRLSIDEHGQIVAEKAFDGPAAEKEPYCLPARRARFSDKPWDEMGFYITTRCLAEEVPRVDLTGLHTRGLREVQGWLDGLEIPSTRTLSTAELVALERHATTRLHGILASYGVRQFLYGAYRRHVVNQSDCARTVRRQFKQAKRRFYEEGGQCNVWEQLITVQKSWGSPADHVTTRYLFPDSPEQAAVRALDSVGLRLCLGNLLDYRGDFVLMTELSFRSDGPFARFRGHEYAWEIWRAHGLELWLERTRQASAVPQDVAQTVQACAERRAFPERSCPTRWSEGGIQEDSRSSRDSAWLQGSDPLPDLREALAGFPAPDAIYSLKLFRRDDGKFQVDPAWDELSEETALLCAMRTDTTASEEILESWRDFLIAERCLAKDAPALDLKASYERALDDVERWLERGPERHWGNRWVYKEEPPPPEPWTPVKTLLKEREASQYLLRQLDDQGVLAYLKGSWSLHVWKQSECYRSARAAFDQRLGSFLPTGERCPPRPWADVFALEPPERLYFLSHSVKMNKHLAPGHPYHQAVLALDEYGLRGCLIQLLERHGDRRTMKKIGMFETYPPSFERARIQRYIWSVWRRFGLEDWIRRTAASNSVPPDVMDAVTACAADAIPERAPAH